MLNRSQYSFEKYKKREVSFLKIIRKNDWNIKTYGIRFKDLSSDNIEELILDKLPSPALTENRYGTGFLIIHKGVVANWIMLNWWGHEDIVHQKLYTSEDEDFKTIKPVEDNSILACVHELDIYNFESNAWKKNILSPERPDFEGYLNEIYQNKD